MKGKANFKVDPKLAALLGESYRSIELAIKELVDNSFDADAETVSILFPEPYTNDPIIVEDDGHGMTEDEIRNEYLKIANSRFSRKGEYTPTKRRLVKGRKGIGKFAGLMVSEIMEISSSSEGTQTTLHVSKTALAKANYDLENIDLPIETSIPSENKSGTKITLRGINDNFTFPNPEKLKQILILEYGRIPDFKIVVNGESIDIKDIPGKTYSHYTDLPHAGPVSVKYTITNRQKALKPHGLVMKVRGKMIGRPHLFGLEDSETIPPKLQKRLLGEIIADKLEADVTADWSAIIENSKAYQEVVEYVQKILKVSFQEAYNTDYKYTKTRLQRKINKGLENLPSFRQGLAQKAIDNVMLKFFGEREAKVGAAISVLLDAFKKDDYWVVLKKIEATQNGEKPIFIESLDGFGKLDKALMARQAMYRLDVLDKLESLTSNALTSEKHIRQVLENNLWVLGTKYAVLSTNERLKKVIELFLEDKYADEDEHIKPALLLASNQPGNYLLLDIKRSTQVLDTHDLIQTRKYKDDLNVYFPNSKVDIFILGEHLDENFSLDALQQGVFFKSYKNLFAEVRNQLKWLVGELDKGE
ncbi:MAG: ATP-binding protein [Bacteroidetes bacterium]|nr:ATP-binding protein [Bacteroidota bacterium]